MFKLITAPSVEPVSVSEFKSQLRLTSSSQDTMLGVILKAARQMVEEYLRYALIQSTWELYLDKFPASGYPIWIQKSPLVSITSIIYINTSGANTTLSNSGYVVDIDSMPGRIYEAYGTSWPTAREINKSVTIRFVSGYSSAANCPEIIKQAILMEATTLYEMPSNEVSGTQVNVITHNSERLLSPFRANRYT